MLDGDPHQRRQNERFIPQPESQQMRIAIYARVSSDNKGQDPENQLRQLRQWCGDAGHEIAHEYIDRESGRKGTDRRKQFAALFEDAHKRKFDCVLFWALDRFTREGMVPTINYLQRLASYGVGFHSYTEPHLATDNEMVRDILLALLASLAKQETKRISERTKAGLARARAHGKRLGRPGIDDKLKAKIAKQIAAGATPYRVAKDLGIDRHTAAKYGAAAPFRGEEAPTPA
jgi:DNA invertase Pin-like site-specific DNA recombinase